MTVDGGETRRPRQMSEAGTRYSAEKRSMLLFRKQIGQLQKQAAFATARLASGRAANDETHVELVSICAAASVLIWEINAVVPGEGVGPAEDCRRALRLLLERLPAEPAAEPTEPS